MRTSFVALLLLLAGLAIQPALADCKCEGCGCKGGPGWRGPDGRCVSWRQLKQICGSPPGSPCLYEGARQICPSLAPKRIYKLPER